MEFGIALYDALIGANVPPDKAKAVVIELGKTMLERLATKQDLATLEQRLTLQLTLRLGAMITAAVAVVVALQKLG